MSRTRNGGRGSVAAIGERDLAVALIGHGLRIVALENVLTRLPRGELSRLWKEIRPDRSAPAGCLPSGAASLLKTPRQVALASALLAGYTRHGGGHNGVIDARALLASWIQLIELVGDCRAEEMGLASHARQNTGGLTINSAWVIVRDYRAGIVHLDPCPDCGSFRIRCDNWARGSKLHSCPFCEHDKSIARRRSK